MTLIPCLLLLYFSNHSSKYAYIATYSTPQFPDAVRNVTLHSNWHLLDNEECGESLTDRIIGGTKAAMGQFPWMVQIGYSRRWQFPPKPIFKCGGTLINNVYVVTAAHCVRDLVNEQATLVRLGEHNTDTELDCENDFCAPPVQDVAPALIIVHEQFNQPRMRNDIALIRLERPAIINPFVIPICLPYDLLLSKNYVGSTMEVAGWGINNVHKDTFSPTLLYVRVPILSDDVCKKHFGKHATISGRHQLCAGGQVSYDSCRGDSGGPLMKAEAIDGPPKYYLIGIVSFGPKICGVTTPATYTNVPAYVEWILNNIEP